MANRKSSAPLSSLIAAFAVLLFLTALSTAQTLTALHNFTGGADGASVYGGLTPDAHGNWYGMTIYGGKLLNGVPTSNGTVFELSPSGQDWALTTLYTFKGGNDGNGPMAGVIVDASGNLYGTTAGGFFPPDGVYGTVFQLVPPTTSGGQWTENVLFRFDGTDGSGPGPLLLDSRGNLFGHTTLGSACGGGVVFELSPPTFSGGAWKEKRIHSFLGSPGCTTGGGYYPTGLVLGKDGTLYGTTYEGGSVGYGVVFKLSPPTAGGTRWTEEVLYSFGGSADGAFPVGGVVFDSQGNIYGAATYGGAYERGVVFELMAPTIPSRGWMESVIYSFTALADGGEPITGLTSDNNGNLYGTTSYSLTTACLCGAIYELIPPATSNDTWTEVTLYEFSVGEGPGAGYGNSALTFDGSTGFYATTLATRGFQGFHRGTAYKFVP